ncbi:MAG: response regulator transcription factor [Muribaculaceae bacterium]|nr:response regulator transcription factor [Muribaculaceae bacterium]
MKQRLLIVEPSEVIIEGLKAILDGQIRFKVLEPEMDVDRLEERLTATRPDILLINPTLVDDILRLRTGNPMAVVALVYQYIERDVLKQYDAVIDIRDSRAQVIETLAQASPSAVETTTGSYELTKRETAVLVQLAQGKTNKEIADALNVSVHTVISHRKNITRKTGIKSVAGLTVYAMLNNLIDDNLGKPTAMQTRL